MKKYLYLFFFTSFFAQAGNLGLVKDLVNERNQVRKLRNEAEVDVSRDVKKTAAKMCTENELKRQLRWEECSIRKGQETVNSVSAKCGTKPKISKQCSEALDLLDTVEAN
jgi:hypothetical protein